MNAFRISLRWFGRLIAVLIVLANLRLYLPSPLAVSPSQVPVDLPVQLAANRSAIEAGAADRMQRLFPEGYFFCYLFHGLAWAELAMRDDRYADEAIDQAKWCYSHLESEKGKAPFPEHLPPDHGMFYFAWKTHLQAAIVKLQNGKDLDDKERLRGACDQIASSLENASSPFLESYNAMAWPCDTIPGIHAMSVYDDVTNAQRYQPVVDAWLADVSERLTPTLRLIAHTAEPRSGAPTSVPRATSQMILLRLMPDVAPNFARQQYLIFREHFAKELLGLPSILEYPKHISGVGDVDSGPLILGRSLSATVMMMGVAQIYGDHAYAGAIAQAGEVVGFPWTWGGSKSYAANVLPVGNIIVAYSHVARSWNSTDEHKVDKVLSVSRFWRWPIHLLSIGILMVPWVRRRICKMVAAFKSSGSELQEPAVE